MAAIDRGSVYVARQSFVVWDGGRMLRFRRGRTTIREGHPLLKGREDRFAPQRVTYEVAGSDAPVTDDGPSYTDLQAEAKSLGLATRGTKAEISGRIQAHEAEIAAAEEAARSAADPGEAEQESTPDADDEG